MTWNVVFSSFFFPDVHAHSALDRVTALFQTQTQSHAHPDIHIPHTCIQIHHTHIHIDHAHTYRSCTNTHTSCTNTHASCKHTHAHHAHKQINAHIHVHHAHTHTNVQCNMLIYIYIYASCVCMGCFFNEWQHYMLAYHSNSDDHRNCSKQRTLPRGYINCKWLKYIEYIFKLST